MKKSPTGLQHHEGFQFGTNPMRMTPFEQSLANREKLERKAATVKYVMGIQGTDGGKCVHVYHDET